MTRRRGLNATATLLGVVTVSATLPARAATFGPGNLVVLRVGDGAAQATNTTKSVSLVEINPTTGSVVQTINLPSTGSSALTLQGAQVYGDGYVTRSGDGRSLSVLGRNVASGSAPTAAQAIASIDGAGAVTLNTFPTVATSAVTYGAVTANGTSYYTATGAPSAPGLGLIAAGTAGAPATINGTAAGGFLDPQIVNGQLYAIQGNTAIVRFNPALPTSSSSNVTTMVNSVTGSFATGYALLDRNASVAGPDTLYVTSDQGLEKFVYSGAAWTKVGATLSGAYFAITAAVNGANADLYVTTGDGSATNNKLQRITDTAAFNLPISATTTDLGTTAGTNRAYEGLAFAPVAAPEPASVALLALGAAPLAARRRRRA